MNKLNIDGLEDLNIMELKSINGGEFAPWKRGGFYISMP